MWSIRSSFTLLALAALAGATVADVGDCDCGGAFLGCGTGVHPVPTPAGTFYVDDRSYVFGNGIWLYEESNEHVDLQRGGSSSLIADDNEICVDSGVAQGDYAPDTLLV